MMLSEWAFQAEVLWHEQEQGVGNRQKVMMTESQHYGTNSEKGGMGPKRGIGRSTIGGWEQRGLGKAVRWLWESMESGKPGTGYHSRSSLRSGFECGW